MTDIKDLHTTKVLLKKIAPLMVVIFITFTIIGLAMPVLPLYVHNYLGLSPLFVGLVSGSQFAASLISRIGSGRFSDKYGPRKAVIIGLLLAVISGLLYLVSFDLRSSPYFSVTLLIIGRAILGGGESFIITGALSWGLAISENGQTGKVIAWIGTAMYAAFAAGAPLGSVVYLQEGFSAIGWMTTLVPVFALIVIARVPGIAGTNKRPTSFITVISAIWRPGIGLSLCSLGFGAVTTFSSLLFVAHGWQPAWLPFTLFASAFIVARMTLGHMPDRIGGARVALFSILVETAGQALMWLAPVAPVALAGATITGLGYALVYPGFGVEAVETAPPESKGLAMGTYTAFLDLALGIGSPLLGLFAGAFSFSRVYMITTFLVFISSFVALKMIKRR